MKQLSYILMATGGIITTFCAMCDADGTYYVFLLIAIALGEVFALIGVVILDVENRRKEKRKADFNMIRRKNKLDADVEYLGEFEDKKIAP